jgi:hypothetical protein
MRSPGAEAVRRRRRKLLGVEEVTRHGGDGVCGGGVCGAQCCWVRESEALLCGGAGAHVDKI